MADGGVNAPRIGRATRTTSESDITVEINLDGTGTCNVDTAVSYTHLTLPTTPYV